MEHRPFGDTGLRVPIMGFGAGHIGDPGLGEDEVGRLLGRVVDAGMTLIDTARSYGASEARIGRHLGHRRAEIVLSTKVGYGVEGVDDWTGRAVTEGIDEALVTMRTDWLDIVHLHSCPAEVLRGGEVVEALCGAVEAGKVRVAAYSGENAPLGVALGGGRFGAIQTSVNLCDQRGLDDQVAAAAARGMGVIAKRPMANAPWRFEARPQAHDLGIYWDRFVAMGLDPGDLPWGELALRFAAFCPGVSTCIVGTHDPSHLAENLAALARGPLEEDTVEAIRAAFAASGADWAGVI